MIYIYIYDGLEDPTLDSIRRAPAPSPGVTADGELWRAARDGNAPGLVLQTQVSVNSSVLKQMDHALTLGRSSR